MRQSQIVRAFEHANVSAAENEIELAEVANEKGAGSCVDQVNARPLIKPSTLDVDERPALKSGPLAFGLPQKYLDKAGK